ncbi:MAG: OsmC family protein [Anaerolineales bacterium]|nr:OsmC family protein [Anaerolineales bacterium]
MATKQVQLAWMPATSFILKDKDNLQIVMKKPKGVSASDLLPMSLIGCSAHDVVEILNKQKQALLQLNVTASATQDDDPPWKFRAIRLHYQAVGAGLDPAKLEKAILLSQEKYCSVYATLKDAVEITHTFETLEA